MKNDMFKIIDDKTFVANWQFLNNVNSKCSDKDNAENSKNLSIQIKELNVYIESLLRAYWRWQKKHGVVDSKRISQKI